MSSYKPLSIQELGIVDVSEEEDGAAHDLSYLKKCPEPCVILTLSKCPRYTFVIGGKIEQTDHNKKLSLSICPTDRTCDHFLNCINKSAGRKTNFFIGMTIVDGHGGNTCDVHLYPYPAVLKKYGRGVVPLIEAIGKNHLIEL
jgi:hypothetical protein